jgi:hypothetical protein
MTSGRLTLYRPEYDDQAHNHCLLGATNAGLAELLGVGQRTIERWIADIPSFAQAVREGRAIADGRVARSLYERAVGYRQSVERVVVLRGEAKKIDVTVQHPPDTQACIFWLRNRQRDLWSSKQQRRDNLHNDDDLAALDAGGEWALQQTLKHREGRSEADSTSDEPAQESGA